MKDLLKCPDCGQYSLTYDWARHGWVCHVYNGFIPDEDTPNLWAWVEGVLNEAVRLVCSITGVQFEPLDLL